MDNFYTPPQSDLTLPSANSGQYGSIEKALAGEYEIRIREVFKEAWELSKGVKLKINLAIILIYVPFFLLSMAVGVGMTASGLHENFVVSTLVNSAISLAGYPFFAGLVMTGVRRSIGLEITPTTPFTYFSFTVPILLTGLIMTPLIWIGFIVFILPGIYLSVAYAEALPLVIDKRLSPWQALETSRMAVTKKWLKFTGFLLVVGFIVVMSFLFLVIPLIWTLPLVTIAWGIVYRNMFGVESETG